MNGRHWTAYTHLAQLDEVVNIAVMDAAINCETTTIRILAPTSGTW